MLSYNLWSTISCRLTHCSCLQNNIIIFFFILFGSICPRIISTCKFGRIVGSLKKMFFTFFVALRVIVYKKKTWLYSLGQQWPYLIFFSLLDGTFQIWIMKRSFTVHIYIKCHLPTNIYILVWSLFAVTKIYVWCYLDLFH